MLNITKNYLLVLLFLMTGTLVAQKKTIYLKSADYDQQKASGKLLPGVKYVLNGDGSVKASPQAVSKIPLQAKTTSTTSCQSCLMAVDATFSVVPFPFQTPPDYRCDDCSSDTIRLGFNFCFYGTQYSECYINNNGNITFGSPMSSFSAGGFPAGNASALDTIMIAPFWSDIDTRVGLSGLVYYKQTPTALIVKWTQADYFNTLDVNHISLFDEIQLIITDGSDPLIPNGNNVAFCYGDMSWTTGDASSGQNGFPQAPPMPQIAATVGANKGDHSSFFQIGRFGQPGLFYDGPNGAMDGVDWLDNKSFYFNVCSAQNFPPAPTKFNGCDTITICGLSDTLYLDEMFLSPENGQITTITASAPTLGSAFTIISNAPGNSPQVKMRIISNASLIGPHIITLTATDNGTPVQSTIVNLVVNIINSVSPNPSISVAPSASVCPGTPVTVTLNNASTYPYYYWSNGAITPTTSIGASGIVYATVKDSAGCYKSANATIQLYPAPIPTVLGAFGYCNGQTNTTLTVTPTTTLEPTYTTYTWTPGSINTPTAALTAGMYTVTVTGSNGCTGAYSFTVTAGGPTVGIPAPPINCEGTPTLLRAMTSPTTGLSYSWSASAANNDSIYVNTAGTYSVTVSDVNNCTSSAVVNVQYYPNPVATFNALPVCPIEPNIPVQFLNTSSISSGTIINNAWTFGDNTSDATLSPYHTYLTDGNFTITLIVTSDFNCMDTVSMSCEVSGSIILPNVVTPNGDGKNDYLAFKNLGQFDNNELTVYNRWGEKVFEKKDYKNDWSPKDVSDGTYYYLLKVPGAKNENNQGFFEVFKD